VDAVVTGQGERASARPGTEINSGALVGAEPIASPLWRQIDRWLNEGGALGEFSSEVTARQ
jgi:hypothetical protein